MTINKTDSAVTRLINLDFLRGFFVVLAMLEHYSYFLNKWYLEYFKDFSAIKTIYQSHYPFLGKILLSDMGTYILGMTFIPWVSQIYLALAAFNIAKDSSVELNEKLTSRLSKLMVLFFVFYLENFIVANDFGQAISFNPIMLWMIVLSIISIFYSKFGVKGVLIITGLSLLRWIIPISELSSLMEDLIKLNFHPSFEYDAKIEYFFTTGCLGFLFGYLHYHANKDFVRKVMAVNFVSVAFIIIYFAIGNIYSVDARDIYMHEHDCSKTFLGSLFMWGVEAIVILNAVLLERFGYIIKNKFFLWVGINSLFIFLAHKILFLKVVMPITTFVYAKLGWGITNNYYEVFTYVGLVLFLCWLIQKFELGSIINSKNRIKD